MKSLYSLFFAFSITLTYAQVQPQLIKDINLEDNIESGSNPQFIGKNDNYIFFTAEDKQHGRELWVSDGSSIRTELHMDHNRDPQDKDSRIAKERCLSTEDYLFYNAYSIQEGYKLYRTNGRYYSTRVGSSTSTEITLTEHLSLFKNEVYFVSNGYLWKITDYPREATPIVEINHSDFTNSEISDHNLSKKAFPVLGDYMYFINGRELWKTNGTASGTQKVFTSAGEIGEMLVHNSKLFFTDKANNRLLSTDGTTFDEVRNFGQVNPGNPYGPTSLTASGDDLYFLANSTANNQWSLYKLEKFQSTPEIIFTTNINPDEPSFGLVLDYNYEVYFSKKDDTFGVELFKTEGVAGQAYLIKDLSESGSSNPSHPVVSNYEIFFTINPENEAPCLMKTDGTTSGTVMLKSLLPGSGMLEEGIFPFGSNLYFAGEISDYGNELWICDGSPEGTTQLVDINSLKTDLDKLNFQQIGSRVMFNADNGADGNELWISDGTESGTFMLKNLSSSDAFNHYYPFYTQKVNDKHYFMAFNGDYNRKLWVTEGSEQSTKLVLPAGGNNDDFGSYGIMAGLDKLYMLGDDLWISDGTEAGTKKAWSISVSGNSNPINPTEIDGKLLVMANDGVHGRELWSTDGTEEGTFMVKDICPGSPSGYNPSYQRSKNTKNKTYFTANDGSLGLWESDGSSEGTKNLYDLPFRTNCDIINTTDDYAFYITEYYGIKKLYSIKESTSEITYLRLLTPEALNPDPGTLIPFNNKMYFLGSDYDNNTYLWSTNGTIDGTTKLSLLYESYDQFRVEQKWEHGGKLYFTFFDATEVKMEIWYTDGSTSGTQKLYTFEEDPGKIKAMQHIGNDIVYIAESSNSGRGLYKLANLTTGIKDNNAAGAELMVFPNPAKDFVQVQSLMDIAQYSLLSPEGKTIVSNHNPHHRNFKLDLKNVISGVYVLQIVTTDGNTNRRKIIVQ